MAQTNQHPLLSGPAAAPKTAAPKQQQQQTTYFSVLPPLCPPRGGSNSSSSTMLPFVRATHPPPNPMAISKLMSPPEPAQLDTFGASSEAEAAGDNGKADEETTACTPIRRGGDCAAAAAPLSPPVSPKDKKPVSATTPPPAATAAGAAAAAVADTTRDPILYPASSDTLPASSPARPLFADHSAGTVTVSNTAASSNSAEAPTPRSRMTIADLLVHDHEAQPTLFRQTAPPAGQTAHEDTLYIKAELMRTCMENRRDWLRKEREQLRKDRLAAAERSRRLQLYPAPAAKPSHATMAPVLSPRTASRLLHLQQEAPQQQRVPPKQQPQHQQTIRSAQPAAQPLAGLHATHDNNHRVTKRTGHHAAGATTAARGGGLPTRIAPHVRGTPRQTGGHGGAGEGSMGAATTSAASGPEPRVRTAAPNREDKDFAQLPDYCPPLHTLPERTNQLKVEWKGTALDLSRDAHRHLLHRDELGLAASLRLDCATYLTSKRRIFMRRLACARIHKEFRKTDAQQACKIDVNKASKLWTAYDKVGWLRLEHMRRHL